MSSFEFKTPQESVGLQFWKLHARWQKRIATELSPYKVTHTQFVILATLLWFQEQSINPSQAEISKVTGIEKMTLSKAIVSLEKLLFIKREKSQEDTRSVLVSLTTKGKKLIPTLLKKVESIDKEVFTTKDADDAIAFTKVMTKLLMKNELNEPK